jgi:hypothetical protein
MKKLLLIGVLNVLLLFSPPPQPGTTDPNGRYVSLGHHAGFFLNPDTYGFIFPAIDPGLMLENRALRQSRPLFILMGSAIGYSIHLITWPLHNQLLRFYGKFWKGSYPRDKIVLLGNFYLGFFILNFFVLWIALFLFEKIFYELVEKTRVSEYSMYALMAFIASNPITKAFFWTVHQQMFSLMTPLLCIYLLFRYSKQINAPSIPRIGCLFFLAGSLMLIYGNFLMLYPLLIYSFLIRGSRPTVKDKNLFYLLKFVILTCLFLMPTLLWITFLKSRGINYYSLEIEYYHQLVWIPESMGHSIRQFWTELVSNTLLFVHTLTTMAIFFIFSAIWVVVGGCRLNWGNRYLIMTLCLFCGFFIFYWLLGYYEERLTNSLIPIVICFWVVVAGKKMGTRKFFYLSGSLAFTWQIYLMLSYGPFS